MTTFEQARRCPRCDELGEHVESEDRIVQRGPQRGSKLTKVYCRNDRCRWFNTAWTIQVRPDGTIPDANLFREKKFPELPKWGERSVRALEEQVRLETSPGAELNNPH